MIALALALLISPGCPNPPLFAMDGPVCSVVAECVCSECLAWEPSPTAEWYEILRHNPDDTSVNVGRSRIYGGYFYDNEFIPPDPQELWCVAWDSTMPREGLTYQYEVRGCRRGSVPECSTWSGFVDPPESAPYVAAPYNCYVNSINGQDGGRINCP